jgi:hypothetical protein
MRHFRFVRVIICLSFLLVSGSGSAHTSSPDAVVLTVSNPYCAQALPPSSTCFINVRTISATSSDPNFLGLEITINGKARARLSNYFETSTYLNQLMLGKGLKVICGRPNASGVPGFGLQYSVGISTIVAGSSSITDTANVTCPSYESKAFLPAVRK